MSDWSESESGDMCRPEVVKAVPLAWPGKASGDEKVGEEPESLLSRSGTASSSVSGSGACLRPWCLLNQSASSLWLAKLDDAAELDGDSGAAGWSLAGSTFNSA